MRLPLKSLIALLGFVAALAGAQEIYQEKSLYRNILVSDDQGMRCMRFGRHNAGRQSCVSLKNPDLMMLDYTKMLLAALYHPVWTAGILTAVLV